METHIQTEIKRKLVWIATGRSKLSGLLEEERYLILF